MPTSKGYAGVMVLMPSIITQAGANADVQVTPGMVVFGGAGGRSNEGRMQVDGLNTGAALNGGGVSGYNADIRQRAGSRHDQSGGLGEAEVGGPSISIVPKTGGNTFKGTVYAAGVASGMVGSNYTDALKAAGLSSPLRSRSCGTTTPASAVRSRRIASGSSRNYRDEGIMDTVPGHVRQRELQEHHDAGSNATTVELRGRHEPAGVQRGQLDDRQRAPDRPSSTPRNKFNVFWDEQHPCNGATYTANDDGCRQAFGQPGLRLRASATRRRTSPGSRRLLAIGSSACSRPPGRRR